MNFRDLNMQKEWVLDFQDHGNLTMKVYSETGKGLKVSWPVIKCRGSQLKLCGNHTALFPPLLPDPISASVSTFSCGSLAITIITDTEMSSVTQLGCSREDLRILGQFFYEPEVLGILCD